MSHKVNLVRVFTAATGNSTPITLGAAYSQLFMTPAEAGAMDGRVYTYLIVDGNDWEMGRGAYTASGTSLARTTIIASRISGTLGTSRITLTGTAQVRFIESAEDMDGVRGTRAVTSTSDVLANSDQGYVVTYSNGSPIAVSLAQAGSSNLFLAGWATMVQNIGVGTVTITPATSTINGAATLTLATGMGAFIWSDGTNYRAQFVPASKPLLAANALSEIATLGKQADARTNLGFTTVGKALAVAADAAAGRSAIGAANIAGEIFTGSVAVRSGTDGYLQFSSGSSTVPGLGGFYTPDGTRRGYIGWGNGSYVTITSENSWGWRFDGPVAPRFSSGLDVRAGTFGAQSLLMGWGWSTGNVAWRPALESNSDLTFYSYNATSGAFIGSGFTLSQSGNLTVTGSLSKASGTFLIDHPLDPANRDLAHAFVESPRNDLLYRGEVALVAGRATIDIDTESHMTPGTFAALTINARVVALQNQDGFARLRPGPMAGATFEIICEDETCTDTVTWMVAAERNDIYVREIDPNCSRDEATKGRFIVERDKPDFEEVS